MNKISGVYEIRNTVNGHRYIGSAVDLNRRHYEHFCRLRSEKHINRHLQKAWLMYGGERFIFSILETCDHAALVEREQFYLDTLIPEYNICRTAQSTLGLIPSPETRAKISATKIRKKVKATPEIRAKISRALIGNKYAEGHIHAPETRARMSETHKGMAISPEACEKISASKIGNTNFLGRKHTPETLAKMSAAAIGNTRCRGRKLSSETRAKIKATNKATAERKKQQKDIMKEMLSRSPDKAGCAK
jgi:group I intron endonuclease